MINKKMELVYPLLRILTLYMFLKEGDGSLPLVINTWPYRIAAEKAYETLTKNNGSVVDAVVAGCTAAEEDLSISAVGWGSSPAENGETILDALIIDGKTHNMGAVGNLKRIKNAIGVARHVLENTKHTLIVGEDATTFALQMGFKNESLSSDASRKAWQNWKSGNCQPNFWERVTPDPKTSCGPYSPVQKCTGCSKKSKRSVLDEDNHDTIGMVAVSATGDIAGGTSTTGLGYKITGRVGDSPIPGSGAYVDNRYGGAAATGNGDIMMRFSPSYQTVENMRKGMSPSKAAEDALRRILKYYPKFSGALVAVNKKGVYGAASVGFNFQYSVVSPSTGGVKVITIKPFANRSQRHEIGKGIVAALTMVAIMILK